MSEEMSNDLYATWLKGKKAEYDSASYWKRIGLWGYPSKENDMWEIGTFTHMCYERWDTTHNRNEWKNNNVRNFTCSSCNEVVPEGLRMIAYLEKI
jgi:hypothetical protein